MNAKDLGDCWMWVSDLDLSFIMTKVKLHD